MPCEIVTNRGPTGVWQIPTVGWPLRPHTGRGVLHVVRRDRGGVYTVFELPLASEKIQSSCLAMAMGPKNNGASDGAPMAHACGIRMA